MGNTQGNQDAERQEMYQHCMECQAAFEKDGFEFSPSMCRFCEMNRKFHEREVRLSSAEQAWDACDWSSSKLKAYYKG